MSAQHRVIAPRPGLLRRALRLRYLVVVLLALMIPITAASARWSSTGSSSGSATTGTLNAPTNVHAGTTAGSGTVSVTWTASTGSPTPTGYYVTRTDSGNNVFTACNTSAGSLTTSTSCSDTLVPVGSYTYRVVAVYRTWTATSAPVGATVSQASQSITFTSTPPANPAVNGTYTVTATGGGSGNPVVFSTTTTSVCTLSGALVTFVHPGTCTIDANQAASTYYTAAPTAHQPITVGKASQAITFTSTAPNNAVVGGATYTVTATGGASGNPVVFTIDAGATGVCSISGAVVTFNHVGTCIVDANQAGNGDYSAAPQNQQSIAVGQGSQAITITSTPPSPANVGGTYTVVATANSGLTVAITLDATSTGCSISGNVVTFTAVGTCKVDANQAGNADWLPAGQMQQSIPVTKVNQTISFTSTAPSNATVGGSTYTVAATATSGLTVTFTVDATSTGCSISGNVVSFTAVGTCKIDANQAGNGTYNAAPQVQQSFSVGKGNQTISFTSTAPSNATVGGTTYTVGASATSGLTVTFTSATSTVCSVSGSTVSFLAVGTCTINANQAGDANWNAASQVQQSFSVGKGNQTITFTSTAPTNATVGGPTYTVTATATSGLSVAFSLDAASTGCTISGNVVSFTAAGTCKIDANQAGNTNWNAAPPVQQSFAVSGAINGTKLCFVQTGQTTCAPASLVIGQGGTFSGKVRLLNASGTAVNANASVTISLSAGGDLATPVATTVTIAAGSSDSETFTDKLANSGNGKSGVLTGHATNFTLTDATITLQSN